MFQSQTATVKLLYRTYYTYRNKVQTPTVLHVKFHFIVIRRFNFYNGTFIGSFINFNFTFYFVSYYDQFFSKITYTY